jgi:hypothetical protein
MEDHAKKANEQATETETRRQRTQSPQPRDGGEERRFQKALKALAAEMKRQGVAEGEVSSLTAAAEVAIGEARKEEETADATMTDERIDNMFSTWPLSEVDLT